MSDVDADDALQEAFVRLWSRRKSISVDSSLEGMAEVTVRHVCIDMLRQRSHNPTVDTADVPELIDDDDGADTEAVAEAVGQLIDRHLSERHRRILIMRDRNGYDFDEIAAELGMNEAAVRVALSRARRTIRQLYRTD